MISPTDSFPDDLTPPASPTPPPPGPTPPPGPGPTPPAPGQAGISLVETLICFVIIAALISLAAPRYMNAPVAQITPAQEWAKDCEATRLGQTSTDLDRTHQREQNCKLGNPQG